MHLGRWREDIETVEAARELARAVRKKARLGEDPRAGDAKQSDAFSAALDRFISSEQIGRKANKSADATKGVLLYHCKPWLKRPIGTIRRDEIETLLESIRDGSNGKPGKPYIANRVYSHLKTLFTWATNKHLIAASPMVGISKPFEKVKPRSLPWFRGDPANAAITALWKAADQIGGIDGKFVKVMVLLAKRKTSLAAMKWEEIGENWFWDAPESDSKNKRLHAVPLPSLAQRVLSPRQAEGLVFAGLSGLNGLQERVRKLSGLDDFIWHGCRHLAESKTAQIGIAPHIRDMLFDHSSKRGSGKGYDHHEYQPEMRDALERWADHIESLVQPAGVQVLR
jgi:hypothetical protein